MEHRICNFAHVQCARVHMSLMRQETNKNVGFPGYIRLFVVCVLLLAFKFAVIYS